MVQNLPCGIRPFHYARGNRIGAPAGSSSTAQEMTMLMLSLIRAFAVLLPWLVHLATWLVARSLNMPQPLVHATGLFVFAQVYAAEMRVGKALCPPRLWRQLQSLLR